MKFAVGYQALEDVRKMKKVQAEALKVCECVRMCTDQEWSLAFTGTIVGA